MGQWLQVDLRNPVQVVAVVTQGLSYSGPSMDYTRSYKISYSNNTDSQQFIRDGDGADLVICRYFSGDVVVSSTWAWIKMLQCFLFRFCLLNYSQRGATGLSKNSSHTMTRY